MRAAAPPHKAVDGLRPPAPLPLQAGSTIAQRWKGSRRSSSTCTSTRTGSTTCGQSTAYSTRTSRSSRRKASSRRSHCCSSRSARLPNGAPEAPWRRRSPLRRRCWLGWSRRRAATPYHTPPSGHRRLLVHSLPSHASTRRHQANSGGKTAMVSAQVDEVKDLMAANIELLCAGRRLVRISHQGQCACMSVGVWACVAFCVVAWCVRCSLASLPRPTVPAIPAIPAPALMLAFWPSQAGARG